MTSVQRAQATIAKAAQRMTEVAGRWNAVEMAAISDCLSTLESLAAELGDALEVLKKSPAGNLNLVESNIHDLTKAALRLERLIDSSASFLRCAPGLGCDESGLYQAGGSVCDPALTAETRGMQA